MKKKGKPTKNGPTKHRFAAEYLIDLNATQAAIRCGYSAKSAHVIGSRLLRDVKISAEIVKAQAERAEGAKATGDRILAEVDALALGDMGEIFDFSGDVPRLKPPCDIPESARRLISKIKVKRYMEGRGVNAEEVEVTEFSLWDKPAALRLAMQHRGMLVEKMEHTGKDGAPLAPAVINVRLIRPDDRADD